MAQSVSVLLCTRNRPQKLGRAVGSILANSYGDFELIVVDQSTDDDSGRTVAAFRDPRIVNPNTYGRTISFAQHRDPVCAQ